MKVETQVVSLPIQTCFEKVEQINPEFIKARCRVMSIGKNRNMSHFSTKAVEDALYSLGNIPVVGFIYTDEDGNKHMGGHERHVENVDGELRYKSDCVPFGVVLENTFSFDTVKEDNGIDTKYLCCDVILWNGRYPEIFDTAYDENVSHNQSMEIIAEEVESLSVDERYLDIKKFHFSALCLLGKSDDEEYNVEPCFPKACVMPYSFDKQFNEMFEKCKDIIRECLNKQVNDEGGENRNMDAEMAKKIFDEFNLKIEDVDFEIGEMTEDELRAKLVEYTSNVVEQPVEEAQVEEEPDAPVVEEFEQQGEPVITEFSSTYLEKRKVICSALENARVEDSVNDHYEFYYLCDFDDEYVFVERYVYENGSDDNDVGRFSYSFDDNEKSANITGSFEKMYIKWLTADELQKVMEKDNEIAELRQFKNERLAEDHRIAVDEVLNNFEDLNGNEEFELLKKNAYGIDDTEVLADKCYALRGRAVKVNNGKKSNDIRMPVANRNEGKKKSPYGDLFEKY